MTSPTPYARTTDTATLRARITAAVDLINSVDLPATLPTGTRVSIHLTTDGKSVESGIETVDLLAARLDAEAAKWDTSPGTYGLYRACKDGDGWQVSVMTHGTRPDPARIDLEAENAALRAEAERLRAPAATVDPGPEHPCLTCGAPAGEYCEITCERVVNVERGVACIDCQAAPYEPCSSRCTCNDCAAVRV
ncbi:hypothetical protein [Polymorphospora rubra]|uniref:Uncharacterized protein n=1 Tax=Polymorphospora rubra TaxID=338584 RepID=A0A810N0H9_9ACTN|nr:hypothetical protein [Polymorphospora rubra]BCJ65095.1 hypothetical protein Prubr_21160 [Polymorphospora rubra]